jgi:hypothetical protein
MQAPRYFRLFCQHKQHQSSVLLDRLAVYGCILWGLRYLFLEEDLTDSGDAIVPIVSYLVLRHHVKALGPDVVRGGVRTPRQLGFLFLYCM